VIKNPTWHRNLAGGTLEIKIGGVSKVASKTIMKSVFVTLVKADRFAKQRFVEIVISGQCLKNCYALIVIQTDKNEENKRFKK